MGPAILLYIEEENHPGVVKISDNSRFKTGFERGWGIAVPYVPFISFRSSKQRMYEHTQEDFSWDASQTKDEGIFYKKKSAKLTGLHTNRVQSFHGGRLLKKDPDYDNGGYIISKEHFGKFSYHYEADYGQEKKLRRNLKRLWKKTGLKEETCVEVPKFKDSLEYNQIKLDVSWSKEYLKVLSEDLKLVKKIASSLGEESNETYEKMVQTLRTLKNGMISDQKARAKALAKLGELIWKRPEVFKAFYERGKLCGQTVSFEVSGKRLSKYVKTANWPYTAACLE